MKIIAKKWKTTAKKFRYPKTGEDYCDEKDFTSINFDEVEFDVLTIRQEWGPFGKKLTLHFYRLFYFY